MRPFPLLAALLLGGLAAFPTASAAPRPAGSDANAERRSFQEPPTALGDTPPDPSQSATTSTIVPVVGNVFGVGATRWITDVDIVNDTGGPVDVALELALAPDAPAMFLSLGPGQVQRLPDIMRQAFGIETGLSPLRVTTAGRRAVTVLASVRAVWGTDVSPLQAIGVEPASAFFPTRILDGLAFTEDERTNVGLVNLSSVGADFLLALQRVAGRSVAVSHVHVPANTMIHDAIQNLFPMIAEGHGFSIVVETSEPETYVYASVIRSPSQEGRFVSSRVGVQ